MSISPENNKPKRTARRILIFAGFVVFAIAAALSYGFFIEPDRLLVNRQDIVLQSGTSALEGLRIAMISDIHGGANFIDEDKIREVVERTNAENPDLIVLLGDYVSQHRSGPISKRPLRMPIEKIAAQLRGLEAKYGVFAVIGNHDDWYDAKKVRSELEKAGIVVLVDELHLINRGDKRFYLLGLRDLMVIERAAEFNAEIKFLTKDINDDIIVLEHNPDVATWITGDASVSPNIRLFLAGHTHGGQVWLPLIGSPVVPSSYGQKYSAGHVISGGVDIFVTTGVGTSIMPVRFLVPPEIAVITLKRKR